MAKNQALGVQKIGGRWKAAPPAAPAEPGAPPAPPPPPPFSPLEQKAFTRGEVIYKELCFACHGLDGRGTPFQGAKPGTTLAPPLAGSKTVNGYGDGVISVVLKGLAGPVNGKTYDAQMVAMDSNDDTWIASVLSYVRNNFDNHADFVSSNDVARVRASLKFRTNAWTLQELNDVMPQALTNRSQWKLTASHNPRALRSLVDGDISTRYESGQSQSPGMWIQIELPDETEIDGVDMDSGTSIHDYARGYKIQVSLDGIAWGKPVVSGHSTAVRNQIYFPSAKARFVRITQTGSDPSYFWSIHELQIMQMPSSRELFSVPDIFKSAGDGKTKTIGDATASSVQAPFSFN